MIGTLLGSAARQPLEILCLGAHSDDIELGCGGSILRLLAEHPASTVHWEIFSATEERADEARASAAAFLEGADRHQIVVNDFRENHFPSELAAVKDRMAALGEVFDPDVIFTHRVDDAHQDHRTIAELTWNTFRDHLVFEYEIVKYEGDLGRPNLFVPLSHSIADRKIALIDAHFGSQRTKRWFRPEVFRGLMNVRGVECNAPEGLAEAFHARKLVM